MAAAPLGAVAGQLGGDPRHERHLLRAVGVVVQGEEPVPRRQVVAHLAGHRLLCERTKKTFF